MSTGYHETADYTGNAHCTIYNDEGRESWNEDSQGNVTEDHVTFNDSPDDHINLDDHDEKDVEDTPQGQYESDSGPDSSDYPSDDDDD